MATSRKTRIKIGVIGLGIIGSRVAANLRGAGHQVYVWSRTPHAAPNFLGSVVEVADLCDVIQIFVSDDRALLEVIRTIAAALAPRHVIAVHATVSPGATRQAAAIVESQGARYLDAPFTGSKLAAQNKQLVYYVGGDATALEEARPVLESTSHKILYVGRIGDASVLKIATNMLTAATVQTLSECLALVRAAGIDGQRLVEAFEFNASHSATSDTKLPAMLSGDFTPNFSLKHMLKDVRLAQSMAEAHQIPLPVSDAIADVFAQGLEKDWGDLDFSVVTKNYDAFLPPEPPEPAPAPAPEVPDVPPLDSSGGEITADLPVKAPASNTETPGAAEPALEVVTFPEAALASEPATDALANDATQPANQPKKTTLRLLIRDLFKPSERSSEEK